MTTHSPVEVLAHLGAGERMAALGAAAMPLSMLFPWYGFKLGSPLSATALDSFNLAHAALLLTAGAVIFLLLSERTRSLPRPLDRGALLIVAGAWAAVLVAFLIADPPDELIDIATIGGVKIRYGAFVAAGGAAAIIVGGVRARHDAAGPRAAAEVPAKK
jgi:hypothetical protein